MELSKKNKILCAEIKDSVGRIVRYSLNEDFRKKCHEVAKVDSTIKLEDKLHKRLKEICKGKEQISVKDATEIQTKYVVTNVETPKQELITPVKVLGENQQRNWLAIASRQANEAKKRQLSGDSFFSFEENQHCSKIMKSHETAKMQTFHSFQNENTPSSSLGMTDSPFYFSSYDHIRKTLFTTDEEDGDETIAALFGN